MKNNLTENELRVMQYIDEKMRAEGINYERMSREDVFPTISIPELAESLGMTPGEPKEALESLDKKEYIKKFRKTNTLDYVIHVYEKWFKRRGIKDMDQWIFYDKPTVRFASNTFINVPIILKVDDKPLIKITDLVKKNIPAGYTTEFEIYNKDGVYIAKVKGSRTFLTPDGEKSNLKLRYPNLMTVCELDGKTLFEMTRKEAAALKTQAELYTPNGSFIKGTDEGFSYGEALSIGSLVLKGNVFENLSVGIQVNSTK